MPSHFDSFVAGWVGGASSVVLSHPLDTIKVRLQTGSGYTGSIDCIKKTLQKEGMKGFYKGMSFPLVSAAAYNACVFGVYTNVTNIIRKYKYGDTNRRLSLFDVALASMSAGGVSVCLGTPIDLIKIRLQIQTEKIKQKTKIVKSFKNESLITSEVKRNISTSSQRSQATSTRTIYTGPIHCASDVLKQKGIRGLYRGGGTMLIRDIPGYALYFVPYEVLIRLLYPTGRPATVIETGWIALVAGGVAGTISWGVMHPVDTIKSRLQADCGKNGKCKYSGIIDCLLQSLKNDGKSVLFRGIVVNSLRGFPQSAALFLGYEMTMRAFGNSKHFHL